MNELPYNNYLHLDLSDHSWRCRRRNAVGIQMRIIQRVYSSRMFTAWQWRQVREGFLNFFTGQRARVRL